MEVTGLTSVGYGQPTKVKNFCFFKKKPEKGTASGANFHIRTNITVKPTRSQNNTTITKFTTQQPITKFTTVQPIKQRRCHLDGWSSLYYLSMCRGACSVVSDRTMEYGNPTSIEEHQNQSK
jgi:hypothetical protein